VVPSAWRSCGATLAQGKFRSKTELSFRGKEERTPNIAAHKLTELKSSIDFVIATQVDKLVGNSTNNHPRKMTQDKFVRRLLEELPTIDLEAVSNVKGAGIVDVDGPAPMLEEPMTDVLPELALSNKDYGAFMAQFKVALHEDLLAGVRKRLRPRVPGTEADLSLQFGGMMKDCKIVRSHEWVTLQAVVDISDFGENAKYFRNELVHISVPSDPSRASEPPMFGHGLLEALGDPATCAQGLLKVRVLPSTLLQLTGNDLSRRLPFGLRWTHMQGLTPYFRKTVACESNAKPVFFEQISMGKTIPWPVVPKSPKVFPNLNEEQSFAVNTLSTTKESGIYYMIGPPGTGKTTALVELLKERVRSFPQQRILVVTPSNRAVQVVTQQFLASAEDETKLPLVTLSTILDNIPPELQHVHASNHSAHILAPIRALCADPDTDLASLTAKYTAAVNLTEARFMRVLRSPIGVFDEKRSESLENALDGHAGRKFRKIDGLKLQAEQLLKVLTELLPVSEDYYTSKAQIVLTTLIGSGGKHVRSTESKENAFHCVVLDEASQTDYAEAMIPMKYAPKLFIQIGDPMQLGAMAHSSEFVAKGYSESMIGRMTAGARFPEVLMLKEQYRMHPSIRKWVSDHSYDGQLCEVPGFNQRESPLTKLPRSMLLSRLPSAFINVQGAESTDHTYSVSNLPEAHAIVDTVKFLVSNGVAPETIGVITFYAAQITKIQSMLALSLPADQAARVFVSTVDGCQGDEKDFVLLSCVRTVPEVGFLKDERRVNVAMSRAKHARWVFGHQKTLAVSGSSFSEFFEWIADRKKNNTSPPTRVLDWRNVKISLGDSAVIDVAEKLDKVASRSLGKAVPIDSTAKKAAAQISAEAIESKVSLLDPVIATPVSAPKPVAASDDAVVRTKASTKKSKARKSAVIKAESPAVEGGAAAKLLDTAVAPGIKTAWKNEQAAEGPVPPAVKDVSTEGLTKRAKARKLAKTARDRAQREASPTGLSADGALSADEKPKRRVKKPAKKSSEAAAASASAEGSTTKEEKKEPTPQKQLQKEEAAAEVSESASEFKKSRRRNRKSTNTASVDASVDAFVRAVGFADTATKASTDRQSVPPAGTAPSDGSRGADTSPRQDPSNVHRADKKIRSSLLVAEKVDW